MAYKCLLRIALVRRLLQDIHIVNVIGIKLMLRLRRTMNLSNTIVTSFSSEIFQVVSRSNRVRVFLRACNLTASFTSVNPQNLVSCLSFRDYIEWVVQIQHRVRSLVDQVDECSLVSCGLRFFSYNILSFSLDDVEEGFNTLLGLLSLLFHEGRVLDWRAVSVLLVLV